MMSGRRLQAWIEARREDRESGRGRIVAMEAHGGVEKRKQLKSHMIKLNEDFLSWIKNQPQGALLSSGARDYLSHAGKLESEFGNAISGADASPASAKPDGAPQFNFGHSFSGGAAKKPVEQTKPAVEKPAPSPKAEDDGDELFQAKSKVFTLKTKKGSTEWFDMGVGSLSVVKPDSGKAFVCFRNSIGKILLRAGIYENVKVTVVKKAATLVLFPAKQEAPPMPDGMSAAKKDEDDEGKPATFSFKFGKVETVTKFKEVCESNA